MWFLYRSIYWSYFPKKKKIPSFWCSYSTLWIFFHMCAKLKKAEDSSMQILSQLQTEICTKPYRYDFRTDWIYWIYLSSKKRISYFDASTPCYEFSPTCAQNWRKLKIQAHRFWANFKLKSILNRKSHGFDFFIQIEYL